MHGFGLISGNWKAKCKRGKAQSEKVLFTVAPRGKSTFSQLNSSSVTATNVLGKDTVPQIQNSLHRDKTPCLKWHKYAMLIKLS